SYPLSPTNCCRRRFSAGLSVRREVPRLPECPGMAAEIALTQVAAIDEFKSPVLRSERVGDVLQNPSPIVVCERVVLVRRVPVPDSARPDGDRRRGEHLGIDEAAPLALGVADARLTEDLDADPVVALDDVRARRPESRHQLDATVLGTFGRLIADLGRCSRMPPEERSGFDR